jgi:L,D-transpeptidase ErfK/SrfK
MRPTAILLLLALVLCACAGPAPVDPVLMGDMAGVMSNTKAKHEDVVFDIARKNRLGILEVLAANPGLDPWLPGDGRKIVLPTAHLLPAAPREGIVVNLADLRLYYFKAGALLMTAPIGIGREGYKTPMGVTKIVKKQKDPTWYLTPAERADHPELPAAMPPGPDNPLGAYALRLAWPSYLIHGTNTPDGVGQWTSRGCIRMYPEDIERLYRIAAVGTKVRIVDQPLKLGRREGELFLQAHPTQRQFDELSLERQSVKVPLDQDLAWLKTKIGAKEDGVDWAIIRKALEDRDGIPVQITHADSHPVSIDSALRFF